VEEGLPRRHTDAFAVRGGQALKDAAEQPVSLLGILLTLPEQREVCESSRTLFGVVHHRRLKGRKFLFKDLACTCTRPWLRPQNVKVFQRPRCPSNLARSA
jgi:hypothetical protein